MASTLVSATDLITSALTSLGVYSVGEDLSAADASLGLRRLNAMMSSWAIQPLTIPVVAREVFTVTANDGEYTIGPGADFNAIRPTSIQYAAILLNASTPPVEVPSAILTEQAWQSIAIKEQTSTQWTAVFYEPTFTTSGWGTINLWPIPTTADNDLVLYFQQPLTEFSNLTTEVQLPPGYEEALSYNLAVRLAAPFGRKLSDDVRMLAVQSRAQIKRQNTPMVDAGNDMASISSASWGYNINTDQTRSN